MASRTWPKREPVKRRSSSAKPSMPTQSLLLMAQAFDFRSRRIVPVLPPRRMIRVKDVVAVVGGDRGVEAHRADAAPVPDRAALQEVGAVVLAGVGRLDVEREALLRRVVDLGHDLVAEIEVVAGDH